MYLDHVTGEILHMSVLTGVFISCSGCSLLHSFSSSSCWLLLTCFPSDFSCCRLESTKGTYAAEWTKWEKQLRDTLVANSEYLSSIQVKNSFVIDGS